MATPAGGLLCFRTCCTAGGDRTFMKFLYCAFRGLLGRPWRKMWTLHVTRGLCSTPHKVHDVVGHSVHAVGESGEDAHAHSYTAHWQCASATDEATYSGSDIAIPTTLPGFV